MSEYYAIRIYCEDCLGDNMGCFGGGWDFARWEHVRKEQEDNKEGVIVVDFKNEAEKIIDLLEEAKNPTSWRYEIVEVNIELLRDKQCGMVRGEKSNES